jgi:hypothetical protein
MKTTYRGFEIEVTRSKSIAGTSLITGVALLNDEIVEECPLEVDSVREGMDEMRCAIDYLIEDSVLFGGAFEGHGLKNAEFCANARTDVPALLVEVERLRGLLELTKRRKRQMKPRLSDAARVIIVKQAEEIKRLRDLMEAVAFIEDRCPWCSRNLFARKAPHEPTCPAFTLTGEVK